MFITLDNYYISVYDNMIKICIDGQNIIHECYHGDMNEGTIIRFATALIEDYNLRHGCNWGEYNV